MFDKADRKPISVPLFQSVANVLAEEMARMNVEELATGLQQQDFFHPLSGTYFHPHFHYIRGLMVNRMSAILPIEKNHYILISATL